MILMKTDYTWVGQSSFFCLLVWVFFLVVSWKVSVNSVNFLSTSLRIDAQRVFISLESNSPTAFFFLVF